MARLAAMLKDEEAEHGRIAEMSEQSLRLWLDDFIQRAATSLGKAAAQVMAYVADLMQIGANAIDTARSAYRDSYAKSRRIAPRRDS